jgi:hypothetical protein
MACLQPTVTVDTNYWCGNAPLDQEKAGGRYAADLILQLPARGAGSVALHYALIGSIGTPGDTSETMPPVGSRLSQSPVRVDLVCRS